MSDDQEDVLNNGFWWMLQRKNIKILSDIESNIIYNAVSLYKSHTINWYRLGLNYILPDDFIFKFYNKFSDNLTVVLEHRRLAGLKMSKDILNNLIKLILSRQNIITFWAYALQHYKFTVKELNQYWRSINEDGDLFYVFKYQQFSQEEILSINCWRDFSATISRHQKLSAGFIEKFEEHLDLEYLKLNEKLDEDAMFVVNKLLDNRSNLSYLLSKHGIVGKLA